MGVEDQKEERDVLGSIYPDEEITDISDTAYRISIKLEAPTSDDSGEEPPTILLNVNYPDDYPDVAPHLDLTAPPNAPKYPFLEVSDDKVQLLESLQSTIEESIGMPMVYSLAMALKDNAEVLIADRQRQKQELRDLEIQKAEEQENRKFTGTVVTRERFLEWRDKFRKEMEEKEKQRREEEEAEEKKKRGGKTDEKKLTGKQLWERGLAVKGEGEGEEDEETDVTGAVENLKVSA